MCIRDRSKLDTEEQRGNTEQPAAPYADSDPHASEDLYIFNIGQLKRILTDLNLPKIGNKKDLTERIEKAPDEIKKRKIVNDLVRRGEVARSQKRSRRIPELHEGLPDEQKKKQTTEARFFKRDALETLLEQGCITENDCDTYNTLRGHLRVVKNISRRTKLKNQFDAL